MTARDTVLRDLLFEIGRTFHIPCVSTDIGVTNGDNKTNSNGSEISMNGPKKLETEFMNDLSKEERRKLILSPYRTHHTDKRLGAFMTGLIQEYRQRCKNMSDVRFFMSDKLLPLILERVINLSALSDTSTTASSSRLSRGDSKLSNGSKASNGPRPHRSSSGNITSGNMSEASDDAQMTPRGLAGGSHLRGGIASPATPGGPSFTNDSPSFSKVIQLSALKRRNFIVELDLRGVCHLLHAKQGPLPPTVQKKLNKLAISTVQEKYGTFVEKLHSHSAKTKKKKRRVWALSTPVQGQNISREDELRELLYMWLFLHVMSDEPTDIIVENGRVKLGETTLEPVNTPALKRRRVGSLSNRRLPTDARSTRADARSTSMDARSPQMDCLSNPTDSQPVRGFSPNRQASDLSSNIVMTPTSSAAPVASPEDTNSTPADILADDHRNGSVASAGDVGNGAVNEIAAETRTGITAPADPIHTSTSASSIAAQSSAASAAQSSAASAALQSNRRRRRGGTDTPIDEMSTGEMSVGYATSVASMSDDCANLRDLLSEGDEMSMGSEGDDFTDTEANWRFVIRGKNTLSKSNVATSSTTHHVATPSTNHRTPKRNDISNCSLASLKPESAQLSPAHVGNGSSIPLTENRSVVVENGNSSSSTALPPSSDDSNILVQANRNGNLLVSAQRIDGQKVDSLLMPERHLFQCQLSVDMLSVCNGPAVSGDDTTTLCDPLVGTCMKDSGTTSDEGNAITSSNLRKLPLDFDATRGANTMVGPLGSARDDDNISIGSVRSTKSARSQGSVRGSSVRYQGERKLSSLDLVLPWMTPYNMFLLQRVESYLNPNKKEPAEALIMLGGMIGQKLCKNEILCGICQDDFDEGRGMAALVPCCNHAIHAGCFARLVSSFSSTNRAGECRTCTQKICWGKNALVACNLADTITAHLSQPLWACSSFSDSCRPNKDSGTGDASTVASIYNANPPSGIVTNGNTSIDASTNTAVADTNIGDGITVAFESINGENPAPLNGPSIENNNGPSIENIDSRSFHEENDRTWGSVDPNVLAEMSDGGSEPQSEHEELIEALSWRLQPEINCPQVTMEMVKGMFLKHIERANTRNARRSKAEAE